jgi:membrane-bound lytic murein transglycosylase D
VRNVKRDNYSNATGLMLLSAALLWICAGCATSHAPSKPAPSATVAPSPLQAAVPAPKPEQADLNPFVVPYYPHPTRMELCGEPVPLDSQQVAERFDREFTLVVYNNAQVYLWLKRMERYFPWIEEQLRSSGLPDDLKYVAVAESDLLPNACSPKGAAGPWQFMPTTGTRYGLEQGRTCDDRYDFERATVSAFRYLQDLNRRFHDWGLAIAAYNCGEGRVQNEIRSQGVADYYHLKLPLETERYVFRILAIKAVLGHPARYGYNLPQGEGYPELRVDRTTVSASCPTQIRDVAAAAGTTYREIKRLNPSLRADEIPAGTHEIKVPEGKGKAVEQNLQTVAEPARPEPRLVRAPEPPVRETSHPAQKQEKKSAHHVVKRGETLTGIARTHKVSVDQLRKANKLKGNTIEVGEKLLIP